MKTISSASTTPILFQPDVAPGAGWGWAVRSSEAPGRRGHDQDRPYAPGASCACLPISDRSVQFEPAVSDPSPGGPSRAHRQPVGPAHSSTPSLACPRVPALRGHLRPARRRLRDRYCHGVPLRLRGRRGSGCTGTHTCRCRADGGDQGVRHPGRHPVVHRSHRRRPPLLLRRAQTPWHERPGHHGSVRKPALGLACPARRRPRR